MYRTDMEKEYFKGKRLRGKPKLFSNLCAKPIQSSNREIHFCVKYMNELSCGKKSFHMHVSPISGKFKELYIYLILYIIYILRFTH